MPTELSSLFPTTSSKDFWDFIIKDKLGYGISRHVYSVIGDDRYVVKMEPFQDKIFQNIMEWNVWQEVNAGYTGLEKWFAPCHQISPCGIFLLQQRTEPLPKSRMPKSVPMFFSDLKTSNWGLLDNRPVCHDYGTTMVIGMGLTNRMKKVKVNDWT